MPNTSTAAVMVTIFLLAQCVNGGIPTFKTQEIDKTLKIGYAVSVVDVNADGKPDIVVVDKERVIWFENPTWKLHTVMEGQKALDNVCLDAYDIDGDGQVDLALGAGWRPGKTGPGDASSLQWFRRGKTLDEPWQMHAIKYEEPTLHRMRWADLDGNGKKVLITVPLTGRGSSAAKNWSEAGVKMEIRRIPADPTQADWPTELITDALRTNPSRIPIAGPARSSWASSRAARATSPRSSRGMGTRSSSTPSPRGQRTGSGGCSIINYSGGMRCPARIWMPTGMRNWWSACAIRWRARRNPACASTKRWTRAARSGTRPSWTRAGWR